MLEYSNTSIPHQKPKPINETREKKQLRLTGKNQDVCASSQKERPG